MPNPLARLIYIDDSGHPAAGIVVYGWIEFAPRSVGISAQNLARHTEATVEGILDRGHERVAHNRIRQRARAHLKSSARSTSSSRGGVLERLRSGSGVECLQTLRSAEGMSAGAVWRQGAPEDIARTRRDAYAALVQRFEAELSRSGELALLFMDGDGSDTSYRSTHRSLKLAERRVIEDAIHLDSKTSQLTQMADLVAWSANAHLDRVEGNKFAWGWYETYLAERDPCRWPERI